MIVFDLKCGRDHVFEAWFKDSETFDAQAAAGDVPCPACGDTEIGKAIMAPRLNTGEGNKEAAAAKFAMLHQALRDMRKEVEGNCDYVGAEFPEEARKIHYGEAESRNIYGEATADEAEELADEGVEFQKIPWVPQDDA